jgi:CheY-like chemotaxis protein
MRVLLVERDHKVRDRVKVALQQFEGTTVDTAEDAWALELAKENPYDLLVISDRLEKQGDGLEIMKQLREGGLGAPAILLSRDRIEGTLSREIPQVAASIAIPPDTVEIFRCIVMAQQKIAAGPKPRAGA